MYKLTIRPCYTVKTNLKAEHGLQIAVKLPVHWHYRSCGAATSHVLSNGFKLEQNMPRVVPVAHPIWVPPLPILRWCRCERWRGGGKEAVRLGSDAVEKSSSNGVPTCMKRGGWVMINESWTFSSSSMWLTKESFTMSRTNEANAPINAASSKLL
jgi:hypothetical protein